MGKASRGKWERRLAWTEANTNRVITSPNSLGARLVNFIEQPLFTLPVGVVGGIVGLIYTPSLLVTAGCIVLAFHRAGVVRGYIWWKQGIAYVLITVIAVTGAWKLATFVRGAAHLPTAPEIASAVWNAHKEAPNPPAQVTNVYQTTVADSDKVHGEAEVYFGYPSSSRGTSVVANTLTQRKAVFDKAIEGGTFNTKLLPGYPKQQFQEIPVVIRNSGNGAIENMSVNIAANTFIEPLTPGGKFGEGNSIVYDIPELPPYTMGAQETILVVKIRSEASAFDPDALIVTVRGKGIKSPHSEVMKYAFMPLPS